MAFLIALAIGKESATSLSVNPLNLYLIGERGPKGEPGVNGLNGINGVNGSDTGMRTFTFRKEDMTAVPDGYRYTVTAAQHGMGESSAVLAFVKALYTDGAAENRFDEVPVTQDGTVTLTTRAAFDGMLLICGGISEGVDAQARTRLTAVESDLLTKQEAKPNGTTPLIDGNNKVNLTYIPDSILGHSHTLADIKAASGIIVDTVVNVDWTAINWTLFSSIFGASWKSTPGIYMCRGNVNSSTSFTGYTGTYSIQFCIWLSGYATIRLTDDTGNKIFMITTAITDSVTSISFNQLYDSTNKQTSALMSDMPRYNSIDVLAWAADTNNVPSNSKRTIYLGSGCTNLPADSIKWGVLRIEKEQVYRIYLEFTESQTGRTWKNTQDQLAGVNTWSGWNAVYSEHHPQPYCVAKCGGPSTNDPSGFLIKTPVSILSGSDAPMLTFELVGYSNYNSFRVQISGYAYVSQGNWFSPKAEMISGSTTGTVTFGKTDDGYLYVHYKPKNGVQWSGMYVANPVGMRDSDVPKDGWSATVENPPTNKYLVTQVSPPYSSSNPPILSDIGALAKSGDTMTGALNAPHYNNFISAGNEFNFLPSAYATDVLINYRTQGGTNGNVF